MNNINKFETINNYVIKACGFQYKVAKEFIEQFNKKLEKELPNAKLKTINTTEELIEEINKINLLYCEEVRTLAYRIEMQDKNYGLALKETLFDNATYIEINNLDRVYDTDEQLKRELIDEIRDVAEEYGIDIEEIENSV